MIPDTVLLVTAGALAGLLAVVAALLLARQLERRRLERRIREVSALAARIVGGPGQQEMRQTIVRRADGGRLREGAALARLLPRVSRLETVLGQAGLTVPPHRFALLAVLGGLTCALPFALWTGTPVLAGVVFPIATVVLPAAILGRMRTHRARAFLSRFPDAIDLVVRAVKSGMPPTEAVTLIAEEAEEPVAGVFREVASAIRIGTPFEDALWNATRLIDVPEFRFFVIALSIQRETGGNLAEILTNLSTMIRRREQMKMKIRAMSSEARASALIIGSLPFIMTVLIYMINPDYMSKLFTDPRGWNMLIYGLGSMGVGMLVIARMVRFEI